MDEHSKNPIESYRSLELAERRQLVDLLAYTDAVFTPYRQPMSKPALVVCELRQMFAVAGLPWRASGDENARKANQRFFESMESAGIVQRFSSGSRSTNARLTATGDEIVRAACGLPGLAAGQRTAELIADMSKINNAAWREARIYRGFGPWICETTLAACRYGSGTAANKLRSLELLALPALISGKLCSAASGRGHVAYKVGDLTPTSDHGLDAEAAAGLADQQLAEYYWQRREHWRSHLETRTPVKYNAVDNLDITLPVGVPIWKAGGKKSKLAAEFKKHAIWKSNTATLPDEIDPVADPDRRQTGHNSLKKYCEIYHGSTFSLEWSKDHLEVISIIQRVCSRGGLFTIAMPRGSGKTSLCEAAVERSVLCGFRRFPVAVGASNPRAKDIMASIKTELESNELLLEDYPEMLYPIHALERIHNRAGGQTYNNEPTRIQWTESQVVFPTIAGSENGGAILKAASMDGSLRGMKHKLAGGVTIRPDFAIGDDPQTDESARSPEQTRVRLKTINGAILGLAGPGEKISCVIPCTVIEKDDLADQLLDRKKNPRWQGKRMQLMYKQPTNEKLWEKYAELRRESLEVDGDGAEATEFYRQHREEMDAGAVVAWEARYEPDEISAIQNAMNIKIDDEETFWAEYQNQPVVEKNDGDLMSVDEIAAKTNGIARGVIPVGCNYLTMYVDVQKAALYWCMAAWGDDFTGYVIDYGTWPDQTTRHFTLRKIRNTIQKLKPDGGLEGQLYFAMEQLAEQKLSQVYKRDDGAEMRIDRCVIDANWGDSRDVVYQFCRQSQYSGILLPSHGIPVGASARPFSEYKRKKGEQTGLHWRIPLTKGGPVRYVLIDANYWKSFVHKRLKVSMGDAGCLSLYGGNAREHAMFAEHLLAEYPVRTEAKGRVVDEWKTRPGKPDNHWLDCLAGSAVAASIHGAKLSGVADQRTGQRKRKRYTQEQLRRR